MQLWTADEIAESNIYDYIDYLLNVYGVKGFERYEEKNIDVYLDLDYVNLFTKVKNCKVEINYVPNQVLEIYVKEA